MKGKLNLIAIIIIGAMLLLTCGNDDDGTSSTNNAPQINSLTANPDSLQRGETSTITCDAVDPQGSALTYFWAATGGSISGSGSSVTWTAPDSEGVFSITCNVENSQGAEASRKVDVHVVKPNVPEQGLIAYYPFTTNANDLSGNNYHGTLLGGATANGYLTTGLNNSDAASIPYQVMDSLTDFTASAWLRINTLQTVGAYPANYVMSGARSNNFNSFLFFYESNGNRWGIQIETNINYFSDIIIKDLKWHHVALVRSGAVARLYVDGTEVGNGVSLNSTRLNLDPNGLIIGQEQDAVGDAFETQQAWAGDVDNLRLYNRALSVAEIQQLANEAHSGN